MPAIYSSVHRPGGPNFIGGERRISRECTQNICIISNRIMWSYNSKTENLSKGSHSNIFDK